VECKLPSCETKRPTVKVGLFIGGKAKAETHPIAVYCRFMNPELTQQTIALQQLIHTHLKELGYADGHSSENLSAHLAQIAVLGRAFSETTLPLFLTPDREHGESLARVVVSNKWDGRASACAARRRGSGLDVRPGQSIALSHGLRRGTGLWSKAGLHAIRSLALPRYSTERRDALVGLFVQLQDEIDQLDKTVAHTAQPNAISRGC
jgi:hypothetical protein